MPQLTFDICGGYGQNYTTFLPAGQDVPFPNPTDPLHPKGATFKGWGFTPSDIPYTNPTIAITANKIMYAIWEGIPPEVDTYEFTFKPNGANGEKYSTLYPAGEMAVLPVTTTFVHPAGYEFVGWSEKADTNFTVKQVLADKDKTLYAVWQPAGSGGGGTGGGVGSPSGNTIVVSGYEYGPFAKIPVSTNGYAMMKTWPGAISLSTDYSDLGKTGIKSAGLYYYDPAKTEQEKEANVGTDHKLLHSNELKSYRLEVEWDKNASPLYQGSFYFRDYSGMKVMTALEIQDLKKIIPDTVPNKTFLGWSGTYNSDTLVDLDVIVKPSRAVNLVPIHRKGEPQFNVTIDANDGTGQHFTIEKIRNELFFVDYSVLSLVSPKSGKVLRGLSLSPTGTPKMYDFFVINKHTTLYCIWADSDTLQFHIGYPSGKTVAVSGCSHMTKMPVTTTGMLPVASATPPNAFLYGTSAVVYYIDPETGAKTYLNSISLYDEPLADVPIDVNKIDNCIIEPIKSSSTTAIMHYRFKIFDGFLHLTTGGTFADLRASGIGAINKKLIGFSDYFNADVTFTDETENHHVPLIVPVVREGDPQFNVTIDANDGSGQSATFENIENEIFYVNYDVENVISPQEGKVLRGLSRIPDGEPLMYDYFLINEDTTLYCIWADE